MKVGGKYYGEALREMESGLRRDDLWGRAYSEAKGDIQQAKGIYLEILAQFFSVQDGIPESKKPGEAAVEIVANVGAATIKNTRRLILFVRYWVVRVIPCCLLTIGLIFGLEHFERERRVAVAKNEFSRSPDYSPSNPRLVLSANGTAIPWPEVVADYNQESYYFLLQKYGVGEAIKMSQAHKSEQMGMESAQSYRWGDETKGISSVFIFTFLLVVCRLVFPPKIE